MNQIEKVKPGKIKHSNSDIKSQEKSFMLRHVPAFKMFSNDKARTIYTCCVCSKCLYKSNTKILQLKNCNDTFTNEFNTKVNSFDGISYIFRTCD